MADFVQSLDTSKLVLVETALSFITAPWNAPTYNFPIFLFGIYVTESQEAIQSMKAFTFMTGASLLFDIIWLSQNEQNWFARLITILILILKLPTTLTFFVALRQRGAQFSGLGFRGNDLNGATVWSMPGGFTSSAREGYQSVEEPVQVSAPPPPVPKPTVPQSTPVGGLAASPYQAV
ncbi:hypothetical protein ABKN59_001226 [Abortiporus biennis]